MNTFNELNTLIDEFKRLEISSQLDFKKLYLYSIITHSTAVEGSTIDETENTLMFDEGIVPGGHNLTEQLMNLDLKRAYDYAIKLVPQKPVITVNLLKSLSALTMRNTGKIYKTIMGDFDSSAGDLRLVNVSAGRGGSSYLNYQKVPQRLDEFCDWINAKRREKFTSAAHVYEFSFIAHYRLVTIHPWADGNGRVSRLLTNMLQMEKNLLPSILEKEQKAEYIKALAKSQEEKDYKFFVDFMIKSLIKFIAKIIEEYKKEL